MQETGLAVHCRGLALRCRGIMVHWIYGSCTAEDCCCITEDLLCSRQDWRCIDEDWRCTGQGWRCNTEDWRSTRQHWRCNRKVQTCPPFGACRRTYCGATKIFAYGQISNTLCNTQFRPEHQDHIFLNCAYRKAGFLTQSKGIPSTDIVANILLRYSFIRNCECTTLERSAK